MPYYVHPKTVDDPVSPDSGPWETFTERADAYTCAQGKSTHHVVTFMVSAAELSGWRLREHSRFDDGTYTYVPWCMREPYWLDDTRFAHLSTSHPGMVAYTESIEKGIQDRQTRIKPGRYLQQFFSDTLSPEQIQSYVAACDPANTALKITTDSTECGQIYDSEHATFTSCMQRKIDAEYDWQHFVDGGMPHPCTVYGKPGDLGIAYLGPLDAVYARCVVWPEKKIFSRLYGDGRQTQLETLLRFAGYTHGPISGARINRIEWCGSLVIPYIDSCDRYGNSSACEGATDCGSYLHLDGGPIDCRSTEGRVDAEPEPETAECSHCERTYNLDDDTSPYCQRCYADSWTCEGCNETFFDCGAGANCTDTGSYCESCYDGLHTECESDHCDHRWIESEEFTRAERATRRLHKLTAYCRACARDLAYCDPCEDIYRPDETDDGCCPTCERAPRCEQTADLLTVPENCPPFDGQDTPYVANDVEPRPYSTESSLCKWPNSPNCPTLCELCHGNERLCYYGPLNPNPLVDVSVPLSWFPHPISEPHIIGLVPPTPENDPMGRFQIASVNDSPF